MLGAVPLGPRLVGAGDETRLGGTSCLCCLSPFVGAIPPSAVGVFRGRSFMSGWVDSLDTTGDGFLVVVIVVSFGRWRVFEC